MRALRRCSRGQISPVVTGGDELGRHRDSPAVDFGSKSGEGLAWTGASELRIDPRHGTELQRSSWRLWRSRAAGPRRRGGSAPSGGEAGDALGFLGGTAWWIGTQGVRGLV